VRPWPIEWQKFFTNRADNAWDMGNLTQILTDLIMNKQDIAKLQVPLNELCMIQHENQSYGPIWAQDLHDIKPQLANEINHMRWRKFGTETWVPLSQLLGHAEAEEIELTMQEDSDNTMVIGDDQIELAQLEEKQEEEQEEELFTGIHQQNVLPPPPSREQFAWGREAVAKTLEEKKSQMEEYSHGQVMAGLVMLLKTNSTPNNASAVQKTEEKELKANENLNKTEQSQEKQSSTIGQTAILKVTAAAVAGLLVLVGLRVGIERMPNSILAFNSKSEGDNSSEQNNLINDNNSGGVNPSSNSSGRAKNRAPASQSSGRSRKQQALERNRSQGGNSSFRDSDAYQRPEIGPDGAGFNDVDRTVVDSEYNMDDGSAPAEQDPLRRKLGRDTVNPDPTDHSGLPRHEERAPASEESPEASAEPPPEDNTTYED
jgi:hypothetical protein